jgi:hypothetical protein
VKAKANPNKRKRQDTVEETIMRFVDVHNELQKLSFSESSTTATAATKATATSCPTTANNNMPHTHKHEFPIQHHHHKHSHSHKMRHIQIQYSQQRKKSNSKQKAQKKKTVTFGQVSIREYAVTIGGDSYKSRDTCPLTLDWAFFEDTDTDCKVVKVVNTKRHNRFVQKCMRLSVQQRRRLVRTVNGLSWKDVEDLENDLVRQRRQRGYYNAFSSSSSNSSREQEVLHEPSALEVVLRDFYSAMPLYTDK